MPHGYDDIRRFNGRARGHSHRRMIKRLAVRDLPGSDVTHPNQRVIGGGCRVVAIAHGLR